MKYPGVYLHVFFSFHYRYSEVIAAPFAYSINSSAQLGHFTDPLKTDKVIPIHYKEDMSNYENYRPIVQPSYFLKIAKKVVTSKINNFMETKNNSQNVSMDTV